MCSYNKTQVSPYDPTKLAIHSILRPEDDLISNCGPSVKKTVSFDDVLHFIDKENMVTYADFDCGITFSLKLLQKSDRSTENGITIPCPVKNPNAFPATINIPVLFDEQHSSITFLNPYNLWDMVPAAPMSLSHTNDTYFMFNQHPQPTTQ